MDPLAPRPGPRPRTSTQIPHRQLDQQPADQRHLDAVLDAAGSWQAVSEGKSRVSVEGARAMILDDDGPVARPEAFLIGREFCHGHAQDDYSLHACLPRELAVEAERAGWAEPHFLVRTGQLPDTVVMIYAPRDEAEADVVLGLLRASHEFAQLAVARPSA